MVSSCTKSNKPKKPNNLISKEIMTDILYDLYVINAAKSINKKVMEEKGLMPERYILDKYNIDSVQFAESNAYYAYYSDRYKDMVEQAKTRIETQKDSLATIEKEARLARQRQDSIRRLNAVKAMDKDSVAIRIDSVLPRGN
jgi:hypothetical protein